ncbi:MAG: DUF4292 domain-containing protein [Ignavibacteriae bacterium]|nr:DUF4292 domain-containing protein [Ignavibacteriota bacterium]
MNVCRWTIFVLVFTFLSGCTSTRKITREMNLSLDEVLRRVHERNTKIQTIKGDGTITVESPETSNSGSFDVYLQKPDSLRLEFRGPFGIRVGTLTLSREQFLFYNWRENVAVVGKADGKMFASMFKLKMKFDEVINAFTGEFSSTSDGDSVVRYSIESDYYLVKYRTPDGAKEIYIDGNEFVVTGYREFNNDGEVTLTAIADQLDNEEDVTIPRLLRVIFPTERRSVTIAYDDVEINVPVQCSFNLPPKAEVIHR